MYQSILIPLDGSKRAERILTHIDPLARHFNSRLILLRVVEPDLGGGGTQGTPAEFFLQAYDRNLDDAKAYLSGLQGEFRSRGMQARTLVERGPVVSTIIRIARQEEADLVAMASHGRTGLSRAFYGSVAAGVLHRIDRPLLLVRADEPG
jgi:nucleotide-binding universal stress UspA family protein